MFPAIQLIGIIASLMELIMFYDRFMGRNWLLNIYINQLKINRIEYKIAFSCCVILLNKLFGLLIFLVKKESMKKQCVKCRLIALNRNKKRVMLIKNGS